MSSVSDQSLYLKFVYEFSQMVVLIEVKVPALNGKMNLVRRQVFFFSLLDREFIIRRGGTVCDDGMEWGSSRRMKGCRAGLSGK